MAVQVPGLCTQNISKDVLRTHFEISSVVNVIVSLEKAAGFVVIIIGIQ